MGTGKTTVGKALAERLGYSFVDTDDVVEAATGKSIEKIFSEEGEEAFREMEARAIDQVLLKDRAVVAVGGGAVCRPHNLQKLEKNGQVVLLQASEKIILERLAGESQRPLLRNGSKVDRIRDLMVERAPYYEQIPLKVLTDGKAIEKISEEIQEMLSVAANSLNIHLGKDSYPVYFQKGAAKSFPALMKRHGFSEKAVLISNGTIFPLHGRRFLKELKKDFSVSTVILPDGESYKNLRTLAMLYRNLIKFKVDRRTPLIALGGGVIGDLVGFAAASFLRGVPFVQIPSTLLAQVDSSIGGKTGIDLPEGKNLVGAFYQPKFVLIDEELLFTLSPRQLRCGLAEVIKYAAAFDLKMFRNLEEEMPRILAERGKGMEIIVRRCCELKAAVVEKDERDTLGIRAKLNFGHTLGHAVEALTRYRKYTHGEAIAMGMAFAAKLSVKKTGFSLQESQKLLNLLKTAGLPTALPAFSRKAYREALVQDKKRVSSKLHFVYLNKLGKAEVIPTELEEITAGLGA